ncbi:MAG: hypothetical protein KatS3mg090_1001 [Patescibacteria group bacterium]|nr:MAG: hypothetical protein KatS3mg090_0117 [Patescibacteria group bacterium]GIW63175.1 MAG: hypothetical protein KatS3mg090_1001 [Patescibacteria group bacterium]
MKCLNCETQMVKGVIIKGGWYGETFAKLNKFAVEKLNFGRFVSAYR